MSRETGLVQVEMSGTARFDPSPGDDWKTAQDVVDEMVRHGGSVLAEWNLPLTIIVRFNDTMAEYVVQR